MCGLFQIITSLIRLIMRALFRMVMSSRTVHEAARILPVQVTGPSLRLHPLAAASAPPVAGDPPAVEKVHQNALLLPNWCYLHTTSNCEKA